MPRSLKRSLFLSPDYFTNLITKAKRAKLRSGVANEVAHNENARKGIKREAGASERAAQIAKKPLHHYVFCSHNIPYWRICSKCGRDRISAERNAEMILGKAIATLKA